MSTWMGLNKSDQIRYIAIILIQDGHLRKKSLDLYSSRSLSSINYSCLRAMNIIDSKLKALIKQGALLEYENFIKDFFCSCLNLGWIEEKYLTTHERLVSWKLNHNLIVISYQLIQESWKDCK